MAPLKVGDKLPEGVKFTYAPILEDDPTVCGRPTEFDANKEFAGKKVVLVSVPGAFTPGCQAYHVPPYIEKIGDLQAKGIDAVYIIAFNDAFYFLSDDKTFFSKNYGWQAGMGDRNGRWALVIEKDGTISYAENESNPSQVTVSGAEAVLAKL